MNAKNIVVNYMNYKPLIIRVKTVLIYKGHLPEPKSLLNTIPLPQPAFEK
jgi:hypothetical protein